MAERLSRGATPGEALLQEASGLEPSYPDREITAWYRDKAFTLRSGATPVALPPEGAKDARSLALDGGRILLRVADTVPAAKADLVLISSVPVDEKLLGKVGAQLGEISIALFSSCSAHNAGDKSTSGQRRFPARKKATNTR